MSEPAGAEGTPYRCGSAARWLPRALAGSIVASVLPVIQRIDAASGIPGLKMFHGGLILVAGLVGFWVLRRGGELRMAVEVRDDRLVFRAGSKRAELRFSDIETLRYDAPFAVTRTWLPATVLIDRRGTCWRLSALLPRGQRLIEQILEHSGREDLSTWAAALNVRERMALGGRRIGVGYVGVALILLTGAIYYWR